MAVHQEINLLQGILKRLPILESTRVFPVPPFCDTIKKDVHLKVKVLTLKGERIVKVHTLPNFCVGKLQHHEKINILLPMYWVERGLPSECALPMDVLALFYNQVVRPAVEEPLPSILNRFPVSYDAALLTNRDKQTHYLASPAPDIPGSHVEAFGRALCLFANGTNRKSKEFLFYIERRRIKGVYMHDLNEASVTTTYNDCFSMFDQLSLQTDILHTDIAIEICLPQHCIISKTSYHATILAFMFPNASAKHIRQFTFTAGKNGYFPTDTN